MNAMPTAAIPSVSGRAVPLRGDDIDTDRIIPARFLRCVTFDGLGAHAFEDDRKGLKDKGKTHPFDDPRFREAGLLFVGKNFGCGSSREHAPQALMRSGIRALVGASFAEIFFGNCVSLGIPCAVADASSLELLQEAAESQPAAEWTLDLEAGEIRGPLTARISVPAGPRRQFLAGTWNPLNELLEHAAEVDRVAGNLPYVTGRWG
jgi:3-isopropylmalate/(R)-2-methylmalate dehydratase small subunit